MNRWAVCCCTWSSLILVSASKRHAVAKVVPQGAWRQDGGGRGEGEEGDGES